MGCMSLLSSFQRDVFNLMLPHSAPSWIFSQAENLASPSLQDGPSLIINLAQLVSPSVALPAELVDVFYGEGRDRMG